MEGLAVLMVRRERLVSMSCWRSADTILQAMGRMLWQTVGGGGGAPPSITARSEVGVRCLAVLGWRVVVQWRKWLRQNPTKRLGPATYRTPLCRIPVDRDRTRYWRLPGGFSM